MKNKFSDFDSLGSLEIGRNERILRSSALLNIILILIISLFVAYLAFRFITSFKFELPEILLVSVTVILIMAYVLQRMGYFQVSAVITILTIFAGMTLIAATHQGVRETSVIIYLVLIVFSALLLGKTAAIIMSLISIASIWFLVYLERSGKLEIEMLDVNLIGRDLSFFVLATVSLVIFYDIVLNRYISEINERRRESRKINEELTERNKQITRFNEELRIAKEKAEESDRLKTAFLTNLSHEIRTPMNGIIGFSELALSPDTSPAQKEEYNSIIANSCQQLLGVVNDIIDMSKIESGMIEIRKTPVMLNRILMDVYHLYSLEASTRDIGFDVSLGKEDEVSWVTTDEVKVRQVLTNLVGNAFKFTERGSVGFGYTIVNGNIEFFVRDTGIGIHHEKQDTIFERFVQEDGEIARYYGGTGLGLSIARAYIENLGGSIWLESEPDSGSTFYFNIPYHGIASGNQEAFAEVKLDESGKDREEADSGRRKCMLVEDVEINEVLLRELLAHYDYEILVARTGEEALAIFEQTDDLDLILMDIKLPDINGLEVTRRIRAWNQDIPVIAQTAYAFAQDKEEALEAGCNDVITKPITQDALDSALARYQ